LTIIVKEGADFNEEVRQEIIETFNEVYPKLRERFNKEAPKDIKIIIDPEYKGVAEASRVQQNINDQGQGEVGKYHCFKLRKEFLMLNMCVLSSSKYSC
jgi:hypothetical protein